MSVAARISVASLSIEEAGTSMRLFLLNGSRHSKVMK